MYNTTFTTSKVSKKISFGLKYDAVIDTKQSIILGINRNSICDLNKNKIASFVCYEKEKNTNGNNSKIRYYESTYGRFQLYNNILYLNGKTVGSVSKKYKKGIGAAIFAILLLLLTIGIILLIDVPNRNNQFEIAFEDNNGVYEDGNTIGVFPSSIHPGSKGEYTFSIKNTENVEVTYTFSIKEMYNDNIIESFPIQYRLKMNNLYIVDSTSWLKGNELNFNDLVISPRSIDKFTLEWQWPYDSGHNELDTKLGNENGKYTLSLVISAQYYEESK